MAIEDQLQKAILAGESIEIIYHGGSQPGTKRTISPISLKNDKVRARCHSSNAVKTFILKKIAVVDGNETPQSSAWSPDFKAEPRYTSLTDLLEMTKSNLINLGWHVNSDENSIALHKYFKNGKPRKGAEVSITYQEVTYDSFYDHDKDETYIKARKSKRPWHVIDRSYAKLDSAAEKFLELANSLAPSNGK